MMLNRDQIRALGLICQDFEESSLRDAGYDLRAQVMMGKKSDMTVETWTDDLDLESQGVAVIVSKEVLRLPASVCAYASVKTSLCREGVMAINAGVVDPGWHGPLSSLMLNFGKDTYRLRNGDVFLRLTFHQIEVCENAAHPGEQLGRSKYQEVIEQKLNKRLSRSFLNLEKSAKAVSDQFNKDVKSSMLKWLPLGALGLALITFLLNFGVLTIASRAMPFDEVNLRANSLVEKLSKDLDAQRAENKQLRADFEEQKKRDAILLQKLSNGRVQ